MCESPVEACRPLLWGGGGKAFVALEDSNHFRAEISPAADESVGSSKKTKNYATQNTHKFNFNAISVPWCLSFRCPKEVGDLTMCGHKASQSENNKLIKSFKLHERVKCNKG